MAECTCYAWRANIEKINGPIKLQTIRSGFRWQWDGEVFKFCPWCGTSLQQSPVKDISVPPDAPGNFPIETVTIFCNGNRCEQTIEVPNTTAHDKVHTLMLHGWLVNSTDKIYCPSCAIDIDW